MFGTFEDQSVRGSPRTDAWALAGMGLCGRESATEDKRSGPQSAVVGLRREGGKGCVAWILLTRQQGPWQGGCRGSVSPQPSRAEQTMHNPSQLQGGVAKERLSEGFPPPRGEVGTQ